MSQCCLCESTSDITYDDSRRLYLCRLCIDVEKKCDLQSNDRDDWPVDELFDLLLEPNSSVSVQGFSSRDLAFEATRNGFRYLSNRCQRPDAYHFSQPPHFPLLMARFNKPTSRQE